MKKGCGPCVKKAMFIKTDNAKELRPKEFLLANETCILDVSPYFAEYN